jgi:hypothetical protein
VWEALQTGATVSAQDRALLRLAATNATLESVRAADLVYTAGGGTALYSSYRYGDTFAMFTPLRSTSS